MANIISADSLINALTNGAITSVDQLVSKRTNGSNGNPQRNWKHWEPRSAGVAMTATLSDQWQSLWTMDSMPRGAGAVPTTWANPTNATAGSLMQTNATGGRNLYMVGAHGLFSGCPGTYMIYDRLGHMGGIDGSTSGDKNINGGSVAPVTRYTNGVGNFAAVEFYSAPSATTGVVATLTYTNDSGSSSTGDVFKLGTTGPINAGNWAFCPLAGGEKGIKDATKINFASPFGAAGGNIGLTIGHPLYYVTVATSNFATVTSMVDGPIPQVLASACLAVVYLPNLATSPICELEWEVVEA